MKKILNLIYLCIDSFANWIHFKVYKSKRRTCQFSISSSKNEFNKIKNFKNSIISTEYEKKVLITTVILFIFLEKLYKY